MRLVRLAPFAALVVFLAACAAPSGNGIVGPAVELDSGVAASDISEVPGYASASLSAIEDLTVYGVGSKSDGGAVSAFARALASGTVTEFGAPEEGELVAGLLVGDGWLAGSLRTADDGYAVALYELAAKRWTLLTASDDPAFTQDSAAAIDAGRILGGSYDYEGGRTDTWLYDLSSGVRSSLASAFPPDAQVSPIALDGDIVIGLYVIGESAPVAFALDLSSMRLRTIAPEPGMDELTPVAVAGRTIYLTASPDPDTGRVALLAYPLDGDGSLRHLGETAPVTGISDDGRYLVGGDVSSLNGGGTPAFAYEIATGRNVSFGLPKRGDPAMRGSAAFAMSGEYLLGELLFAGEGDEIDTALRTVVFRLPGAGAP